MRDHDPLVAVPVFGDTSRLSDVIVGLDALGLDVIVVNDGNGPALNAQLVETGRRYHEFPLNRGVGAATHWAVGYAARSGYPGVIAVDADGAHPLVAIAQVLAAARRDLARPVLTERFGHLGARYVPASKIAANEFAADAFHLACGYRLADVSCGLRYYPSVLADHALSFPRFGFVFDLLRTILSRNPDASKIPVFVEYPQSGPYLTSIGELCDFVEFCLANPIQSIPSDVQAAFHTIAELRQSTKPMTVELGFGVRRYAIDTVPSRRAALVTRVGPDASDPGSPRLPNPRCPAIGIIPDGGGRWARLHNVPLRESYAMSFRIIRDLVRARRDKLALVAVYGLSGYNLRRQAHEVTAALDAVTEAVDALLGDGVSPIVYGDLCALPQPYRERFVTSNLRVCADMLDGFPLVLCVAYSSAWEQAVRRSDAKPWDLGLTPGALMMIENARFASVLRGGGANTLSDFLPLSSAYAVTTYLDALFNDIDVVGWADDQLRALAAVRYGD